MEMKYASGDNKVGRGKGNSKKSGKAIKGQNLGHREADLSGQQPKIIGKGGKVTPKNKT